jgi:hypothetical protein
MLMSSASANFLIVSSDTLNSPRSMAADVSAGRDRRVRQTSRRRRFV